MVVKTKNIKKKQVACCIGPKLCYEDIKDLNKSRSSKGHRKTRPSSQRATAKKIASASIFLPLAASCAST